MWPVFTTADLYDAHPDVVSACTVQFRDFGGVDCFAGPIRTLRCDDDNLDVREVLATPGVGAVLVVDNAASLRVAMVGDRNGAMAADNGWAGVIVNGVVRDSAELSRIALGVRALGTNPARATKAGGAARDVPVVFGGVTFTPGHWVFCDADGIVVAPHDVR